MPFVVDTPAGGGLRDIWIGRLSFPATGPITESLGSEVTAVGEATAVGQRRAKGFALTLMVHGFNDQDAAATGNMLRRQLRALLQNHNYRLSGTYIQFRIDPERNGWLVIGEAELADVDGGPTFGSYQLSVSQAFRVGGIATHREGFRVDLTDLRQATSAIDYQGQMVGAATGFSTLTPLALAAVPIGAYDVTVLDRPVALASRTASDGTTQLVISPANGDVVSWERSETDFNKGDVVIYDRQGNTSANPTP